MNFNRLHPLHAYRPAFDRYFLSGPGVAPKNVHDWQPLADVRETEDAYRMDVELPAVDPKDVRIRFDDGVLTIAGERRPGNGESDRMHRTERAFGKFARRFRLPEDADAGTIRATARHGVLTITVVKSAKARARKIEVEAI